MRGLRGCRAASGLRDPGAQRPRRPERDIGAWVRHSSAMPVLWTLGACLRSRTTVVASTSAPVVLPSWSAGATTGEGDVPGPGVRLPGAAHRSHRTHRGRRLRTTSPGPREDPSAGALSAHRRLGHDLALDLERPLTRAKTRRDKRVRVTQAFALTWTDVRRGPAADTTLIRLTVQGPGWKSSRPRRAVSAEGSLGGSGDMGIKGAKD